MLKGVCMCTYLCTLGKYDLKAYLKKEVQSLKAENVKNWKKEQAENVDSWKKEQVRATKM